MSLIPSYPVLNRGTAPDSFLAELIAWAKTAPDEIFAPNPNFDIFNKVRPELGPPDGQPWPDLLTRKAVMLEVLRVLAGFESSWDWSEGVDTSRLGATTAANAEAGAWQTSFDSRGLDASLRVMLVRCGVTDGVTFQRRTKFDHPFAMEYMARLLRIDVKDPERLANGPLYKGEERDAIRKSLRDEKNSIYFWVRRNAVAAFKEALQNIPEKAGSSPADGSMVQSNPSSSTGKSAG